MFIQSKMLERGYIQSTQDWEESSVNIGFHWQRTILWIVQTVYVTLIAWRSSLSLPAGLFLCQEVTWD